MGNIIMNLNGTNYESKHAWASLENFHNYMALGKENNEFPEYSGDGSEGGMCYFEMEEIDDLIFEILSNVNAPADLWEAHVWAMREAK